MINDRVAPLYEAVRNASAADDDIAKLYTVKQQRHIGARVVAEALAALGPLRDDLDLDAATDVLWLLKDPALYTALVGDRGWPTERYQAMAGPRHAGIAPPRRELAAGTGHGETGALRATRSERHADSIPPGTARKGLARCDMVCSGGRANRHAACYLPHPSSPARKIKATWVQARLSRSTPTRHDRLRQRRIKARRHRSTEPVLSAFPTPPGKTQ